MNENLIYGFQVTVIGMSVVFISLIGLSYVMVLLNRFFGLKSKVIEKGAPVKAEAKADPAPVDDGPVPEEVVAVITGALAVYLDAAPKGLRIHIRRPTPGAVSPWSMAGRQELMNLRQL